MRPLARRWNIPDEYDLGNWQGMYPPFALLGRLYEADEVAEEIGDWNRTLDDVDEGRKGRHCCPDELVQLIEADDVRQLGQTLSDFVSGFGQVYDMSKAIVPSAAILARAMELLEHGWTVWELFQAEFDQATADAKSETMERYERMLPKASIDPTPYPMVWLLLTSVSRREGLVAAEAAAGCWVDEFEEYRASEGTKRMTMLEQTEMEWSGRADWPAVPKVRSGTDGQAWRLL